MRIKSRQRTKDVTDNRIYNMLNKTYVVYCAVCSRRSGRYDAYCGPSKANHRRRQFRTWKYNRKTQYK